ncbi:hypothetical protein ES705_49923 [subsurface metagenome]
MIGVNDTEEIVSGMLSVKLLNFKGEEIDSLHHSKVDCAGDSVKEFLLKPLDKLKSEATYNFGSTFIMPNGSEADLVQDGFNDRFIYAEWKTDAEDNNTKLISTSLFLCKIRDCDLEEVKISVRQGAVANALVLKTSVPVFYVFAESVLPGQFDDAGFTLLPGQEKVIFFKSANGTLIQDNFLDTVTVRHLRDSY